jgi:hypothetical protein
LPSVVDFLRASCRQGAGKGGAITGSSTTAERAVSWIKTNLGDVAGLHRDVVQVIWVTVYRALETGNLASTQGPHGLTSDALRGGDFMWRLGQATRRLEYLKKIIPLLKSETSSWRQAATSKTIAYQLKYDMPDVLNMSLIQRAIARRRTKIDPMYDRPVPPDLR